MSVRLHAKDGDIIYTRRTQLPRLLWERSERWLGAPSPLYYCFSLKDLKETSDPRQLTQLTVPLMLGKVIVRRDLDGEMGLECVTRWK